MLHSTIVAAVCALVALAAHGANTDHAFDAWDKALPDDYGLTTRAAGRAAAKQLRAVLEAGQPTSARRMALYGKMYAGLTWVEDDGGGHMALEDGVDAAKIHVMPRGFTRPLLILGAFLKDRHYDPSILDVDQAGLRDMARQLLALQTQQPHMDFDFGASVTENPTDWVKGWAEAHKDRKLVYFQQHYLMLEMFDDLLTEEQRQWYLGPALEGVMGHRMSPKPHLRPVVSAWGPAGNTLMEENMWGLGETLVRALYFRKHRVAGWEAVWDEMHQDLVNVCSTWHLQACTEAVEGKPINAWATGSAWHADFTIENHTWPDVMYTANANGLAAIGAARCLCFLGDVPRTFLYNFDPIARQYVLPLTLWRGRIYFPNDRERERYGEVCDWFAASAQNLATYLKLRHRDPRAARLGRNVLAYVDWATQRKKSVFGGHAYEESVLGGHVEVTMSSETELQQWLSRNALFWTHPTYKEFAVNRTPHRMALFGPAKGSIDWAVIPRGGDWVFSQYGRIGEGGFSDRKSAFFGGGFAAVGRKPGGACHAMVALPDEKTVLLFSKVPRSDAGAAAPCNVTFELLMSELSRQRRTVFGEGGAIEFDRDQAPAEAAPMPGAWLNVENKAGYLGVHPADAVFAHGKPYRVASKESIEHRVAVTWPNAPAAAHHCLIIVADQAADATRALARRAGARWLDTGNDDVMAALVPAQDGSEYVAAVNGASGPAELRVSLPAPRACAVVLGREPQRDGNDLVVTVEGESVAVVQVAAEGTAPSTPQVRLLEPDLRTVFVDRDACKLEAQAAGLGGVAEVRFCVNQDGIFAPGRVLAVLKKPPFEWTWRPAAEAQGRYAELWAEAVGPDGRTRKSSAVIVMVGKPPEKE